MPEPRNVRDAETAKVEVYDYIVIGAGSGGSAVAGRLSEDAANAVLLLEAGPADVSPWIRVPIGFGKLLGDAAITWPFETEPEPNLGGRRMSALRGKVLGGTSAINGLVYARGSRGDYDLWRDGGAAGWGYDDLLPYFRKAQRQARGADAFHGADGRLGVEDARWPNPLAEAFLQAAESVGLRRNPDFNGAELAGVGYYQMTTWRGRRCSAAEAYLKPARRRRNLTILTEARALKLEFDGRAASGVVFERRGQVRRARARREIILTAGSVVTPQLLQLSGVGPAGLLREHGIEVVHDLAGVGENLIDHFAPKRSFTTTHGATFNAMMRHPVTRALAGLRYILRRSGPLAVGAALAGGFACTRSGLAEPDIQFFFMPFEAGDLWGRLPPTSSFQTTFYQSRPQSRGWVRIGSSDPHDAPKIQPNYLSAEIDVRTAIDGLRLMTHIGAAAPLKALGVEDVTPVGAESSDAELLDYIRRAGGAGYHHVGTCRLGASDDPMAVVDPELRVRGVGNLRVADGSVMPSLISGNTNAACIMIGEKCADLIRLGKG